jgi:hypothetical protein
MVNGKELAHWPLTINNGPRDDRWTSLPTGDHLEFTYAMGAPDFSAPGTYDVVWVVQGHASKPFRIEVQPADTTNLITTADVPAQELAVQCPVVVYAKAQTNNAPRLRFFVAEVWKGAAEASRAGITNGIELPVNWPSNGGPLPEGAVVFYQRQGTGALQVRSEWMVRDGRVGGMDTNKFKTKCASPVIQSD